jgi:WD40 repeat protein
MTTTINPFPGLRPFESGETHLFFGRDGQSEEIIRRLGRTRFLAVVGTSGSGKSSLVRAGLLSALQGGLMSSAGSDWRIAMFRPGHDPVGNLARALAAPEVFGSGEAREAEMQAALTEATLRRSSLGLLEAVRQARGGAAGADGRPRLMPYENLLVVVDQFEELFRFRQLIEVENSKEDAAAFVRLLLETGRRSEEKIYVVLTMRSDFLGDCAQFQGLPEAINDGQYLIPRMTRDERREAVTGPVAVGGGRITDPLVNQLLNDMGDNPDQLPILQHALMRTWDYWEGVRRDGEPIDLPHYWAVGGMSEALSRHAEEAYGELGAEGQAQSARQRVAEKLFKALAEKGADNREIRRPVETGEACEITEAPFEEVASVVEAFRRAGRSFLVPPAGVPLDADSLIDISHESLIRNWARLKKWTDEEAQSARIYRRLTETAVLHKAGEEALLKDPALQVALDWRVKNRPNAAWARRYHPEFGTAMSFLDASAEARKAEEEERARQQRRDISFKRTKLVAFLLAFSVLLALASAVYAFRQRSLAERLAESNRELLYPADISLTQQAYQSNNFARADELLYSHMPAAGEPFRFEWRYLWHLTHNEKEVFNLPGGSAFMALAPDGRTLLIHDKEGIGLLDPATGKKLPAPFLGPDGARLTPFQLSPDGKTLLASGEEPGPPPEWKYIFVDTSTGQVKTLPEALRVALALAFSPDGKSFAWADGSGKSVRLWDVESLRELGVIKPGYDAQVLAFSPDGRMLATGGAAPSPVLLWDTRKLKEAPEGKNVHPCEGEDMPRPCAITPITDDVKVMAFSPDSETLMIGFADRAMYKWAIRRSLWGDKVQGASDITSIAFSPDGKLVVAGFGSGFIRVNDSESLLFGVKLGGHQEAVRSLAFSRDGRTLYTGSVEAVKVWDVDSAVRSQLPLGGDVTKDPGKSPGQGIESLAFSPDGRTLVSDHDNNGLAFWDVGTRRRSEGMPQDINATAFAFSPDGKTLAYAVYREVILWDRAARREAARFKPVDFASAIAYSPDGKTLTTGGSDGVTLWDISSPQKPTKLREVLGSRYSTVRVAYSPDGRSVAARFVNGTIKIWDDGLNAELLLAPGASDGMPSPTDFAFSPDGRFLAVGLDGGYALADSRVRIKGGFIRLWEIKTEGGARQFKELPPLRGHRDEITSLAFSHDSRTLYSSDSDGTAKLWDMLSFREMISIHDDYTHTTAAAFSPDGRMLAFGDETGSVRLWDAAENDAMRFRRNGGAPAAPAKP